MSPETLDELIGELRRTHLGRDPQDVAAALVYRLGLIGYRDVTADNPKVKAASWTVATGVPFLCSEAQLLDEPNE